MAKHSTGYIACPAGYSEEWRPVVGYEAYYEVSSIGRIRRIKASRGAKVGLILRPFLDTHGYPFVMLAKCNKVKPRRMYLHRAVAAAFIHHIPDGHEVNHVDGNPHNSFVGNLEIITRQGNVDHAWTTGLTNNHGSRSSFAK